MERKFFQHNRPRTRHFAVRCAMVFSEHGGAFPRFTELTLRWLGWSPRERTAIRELGHEADVSGFFQWLIEHPNVEGIINLASPNPLRETDLMGELRQRVKPIAASTCPSWLLSIGACFVRTETELVLKSRRVVPLAPCNWAHLPTSFLITALDDLFAQWRAL